MKSIRFTSIGMALLALACIHWLATGVPVPLVNVDHIPSKEPAQVYDGALSIANEQYRSPILFNFSCSPIFRNVIERGIYLSNDVVRGMVRISRPFPDPYIVDLRSVNLVALSLALSPNEIRPDAPSRVRQVVEHYSQRMMDNREQNPADLILSDLVAVEGIERVLKEKRCEIVISDESHGHTIPEVLK